MIKKFLIFIIYSHLFLSLSVGVFSLGILKTQPFCLSSSLALSLTVLGVYNYNRLNKLKLNILKNYSSSFYKENTKVLSNISIFSISLAIIIYLNLVNGDINSFLLLILSGIICGFYILSNKKMNLREIPGMKSFWIASVWTISAIILPKIIFNSFKWNDLHFFILFFALSIPGDVRDAITDNPKMKTIPQTIGNRKSEVLFYVLIVLFLFLNNRNMFEIILIFLLVFNLYRSKLEVRNELIDGILMVLGIIYLID